MNKQTKSLRKLGISRKVMHGQQGMRRTEGGTTDVKFEITKGRCVNSSKEREAHGRKPFQGALKQRPKSLGEPVED